MSVVENVYEDVYIKVKCFLCGTTIIQYKCSVIINSVILKGVCESCKSKEEQPQKSFGPYDCYD